MPSPIADNVISHISQVFIHIFHPLQHFASNSIAPADYIPHLKRAILCNGALCAGLYVLSAIIVNHVRRLLVPWLGQFIWLHAIENMKFARSSPHYFIEATSYFEWRDVCFWICQRSIVYFVRGGVMNRLVRLERDSSLPREPPSNPRNNITNRPNKPDKILGTYAILYLAITLTLIESYYTQTCFSAAYIYAISHLLLGGNDEKAFLFNTIRRGWLGVAFQTLLVSYWACRRFVPCGLQAIEAAAAGRVALPAFHVVLWGGTAYLVRYSNKYFILLELSDMLVTFGWMVLGGVAVLGFAMERIWKRGQSR